MVICRSACETEGTVGVDVGAAVGVEVGVAVGIKGLKVAVGTAEVGVAVGMAGGDVLVGSGLEVGVTGR